MTDLNNPAGRLHSLLEKIRDIEASTPTATAWGRVLGLPEDSSFGDLLAAIAPVFDLPDQIEAQIRRDSELDADLHLTWRTSVDEALAVFYNPGAAVENVRQKITDATLLGLRYCDSVLRKRARPLPSNDDLAALRAELADLAEAVTTADIEPALARFLLEHIEDMERALRLVPVLGADGVRAAVERSIGATVFRAVQQGDDITKTPLGRRFAALVSHVAITLGIAADGFVLEEGIRLALG